LIFFPVSQSHSIGGFFSALTIFRDGVIPHIADSTFFSSANAGIPQTESNALKKRLFANFMMHLSIAVTSNVPYVFNDFAQCGIAFSSIAGKSGHNIFVMNTLLGSSL
jgi:hypothetical protein